MGFPESNLIFRQLLKELPPAGHLESPFCNDREREQFIRGIIALITQNGQLDLSQHDFKLVYSERGAYNTVVAYIVAFKDGVIRAKLEPVSGGYIQEEAFKVLRKDIGCKFDRLLKDVPSLVGNIAGPSATLNDAPPPYTKAD